MEAKVNMPTEPRNTYSTLASGGQWWEGCAYADLQLPSRVQSVDLHQERGLRSYSIYQLSVSDAIS
jgi:hypothetical protein